MTEEDVVCPSANMIPLLATADPLTFSLFERTSAYAHERSILLEICYPVRQRQGLFLC